MLWYKFRVVAGAGCNSWPGYQAEVKRAQDAVAQMVVACGWHTACLSLKQPDVMASCA